MTLPVRDYAYNLHRVLWSGFDPATLPANPVWPNPQGLRATGAGLVLYRRDAVMVQLFLPNELGVDHRIDGCNVRLYDGGWALDAPIGYGNARPQNQALAWGYGSTAKRKLVSTIEFPDGFEVTWESGGDLRGSWAGRQPQQIIDLMRTTVRYTHDTRTFHIVDEFQGTQPNMHPISEPDGFYDDELAPIKAAPAAWQRIQHTPVEPTPTADGFTWTAKNGQTVTLTTSATKRLVEKCSGVNMRGDFHAEELTGWLIRLCDDSLPSGRIETRIGVN